MPQYSDTSPKFWPRDITVSEVIGLEPHADTHASGGTDPVSPQAIGAIPLSQKGVASGVASLDSSGKILSSQIPDLAITHYLGAVNSEAEMLALVGDAGDWVIREDSGTVWIVTGEPTSSIGSWTQMSYPPAPVSSVAGKIGDVTLDNFDVGLGNVLDVEQAPATRSISTGLGLLGGGDLTQNRTLSCAFGFGEGEVCEGNDPRLSNARTPTAHTHPISDVTNLQTTLDGKAAAVHTHVIGDVTNLQTTLDGKAAAVHTHVIGDVTGLQTALDGKAASSHTHAIADVTGLQTALDSKASSTHTHAIADVTGLQTALDGKAALAHTHTIADVSNLQTTLDGKAPTSHTHTIANVTGLQTALDGKVPTTRAITAGTGLTGGGALSVDRTLTVVYGTASGTACQGNDSRLSDARTPLAHTHAIADVVNLSSELSNRALTTTTISAGTGLSGGGSLAANRTLAVTYGTAAGTSCQGNDSRLSDARTPLAHTHPISEVTNLQTTLDGKVPTSLTITTSFPLTGGGNLSANRTLGVAYANGITVDDDGLAVNTGLGLFIDDDQLVQVKKQRITGSYTINIVNPAVGQYIALDLYCPAARDLINAYGVANVGSVSIAFARNLSTVGMPVLPATAYPGTTVSWTGAADLTAGNNFGFQITAVSGGATVLSIQVNYTELATVL